jgi:hypothetical protein
MSGGPNIVYWNMIGKVIVGGISWKTNSINLPFPDSNETYNVGTIILSPE